jgi:nucleotide-binding universal stress UspA family protein
MTKQILVPLDGSKEAEAILPEVQRVATVRDHIHLLHLLPAVPAPVGLDPTHVVALHDQAAAYLDVARERQLSGQKGLNMVGTGDPAEGILGYALEKNIDLIAMTTHGRGGVARFLFGSVAATVVRKAQLPVLLTRPDILHHARPLRRILVTVEASETPKDLLETVKSLAGGPGTDIVLFHAVPPVQDPSPQWALETPLSLEARPEHHLQELADTLEEQGYSAWPSVMTGDPVEKILEQARKLDVDLIALATHARSGLERLVAGSVAEGVLQKSPVSVLLQKPLVIHHPALTGEPHE